MKVRVPQKFVRRAWNEWKNVPESKKFGSLEDMNFECEYPTMQKILKRAHSSRHKGDERIFEITEEELEEFKSEFWDVNEHKMEFDNSSGTKRGSNSLSKIRKLIFKFDSAKRKSKHS